MSDQLSLQSLLESEPNGKTSGLVECLGLTFASDTERRAHFTALLAE